MNNACMAKLHKLKNSESNTQRKLAEFFLDHLGEMRSLTLTAIANETQTAYSTVCRFVKELGAGGFKEFKKKADGELKQLQLQENVLAESHLRFDPSDSFDVIANRVSHFAADLTGASHQALSAEHAEQICRLMKHAGQILFFGLGASSVSAQYAYVKLFRLKKGCCYGSDTVLAKMNASMLDKNDILFVFSSSGRTKAVLETVKIAKLRGASVIAFSDFINTPLYQLADINVCTTLREQSESPNSDLPLIQVQVTVLDILYKYLYVKLRHSEENQHITLSAISFDKQ